MHGLVSGGNMAALRAQGIIGAALAFTLFGAVALAGASAGAAAADKTHQGRRAVAIDRATVPRGA